MQEIPTTKIKFLNSEKGFSLTIVPKVGVEPTRDCSHRILSPACLPVPPLRHSNVILSLFIRLSTIQKKL